MDQEIINEVLCQMMPHLSSDQGKPTRMMRWSACGMPVKTTGIWPS